MHEGLKRGSHEKAVRLSWEVDEALIRIWKAEALDPNRRKQILLFDRAGSTMRGGKLEKTYDFSGAIIV